MREIVLRVTEEECAAAIASKVRAATARKGWSVQQLADFAGVSPSGVWAVLAGERLPSTRLVLQLANALECTPSRLIP